MSTGTASKNYTAATLDCRDELDAAIKQGLRQGLRQDLRADRKSAASNPWQASSPSHTNPQTTDALPDESLLKYVDGALDPQGHAAFEHRLLQDSMAREQVVVLKTGLAEAEAQAQAQVKTRPPAQPAATATRVRYVFHWTGGYLRFLRGTTGPEAESVGDSVGGPAQAPDGPATGPTSPPAARPAPTRNHPPTRFCFSPHFGLLKTRLQVEAAGPGRASLCLDGHEQDVPFCGAVSFTRDGAVHTQPFDATGRVRLDALDAGRHELRIVRSASGGSELATLVVDLLLES